MGHRRVHGTLAGVCVALVGAAVLEGSEAQAQYAPRGITNVQTFHDMGLQFLVGGGIQDFTRETARGSSNLGGQWEAAIGLRPTFGGLKLFGFELTYIGTAQTYGSGGPVESTLTSQGFEGVVRIQPDLVRYAGIAPYLFGGMGGTWFTSSRSIGQGVVTTRNTSDATFTVPVGVGIQGVLGPVVLDLRGAWRFRFDNDLLTSDLDRTPELDTWSLTLRAGVDL